MTGFRPDDECPDRHPPTSVDGSPGVVWCVTMAAFFLVAFGLLLARAYRAIGGPP